MAANPQASPPGNLYLAHQKVYPREVTGRFTRARNLAVVGLLGLFYILPWVRWDGHQAVLFDLPARKFYIFGLTFFPQDFFLLTWLLIIAALGLFFFTALAGRLWCGYACPQTVWTELFVWIERLTEGSRAQQMKLAKAPWSPAKIVRKGSKQFLWIALALFTGVTFVGYFSEITTLAHSMAAGTSGGWETFWTLFYGFAIYGNAGHMREQVCTYMCPYARFQGAMFDRDTLVISYDGKRGEPRGARPRGVDARSRGLGDCVDCTLCVQVCPTGIDIREGLQLECIACAACIDACDDVMDKLGSPRGLIRYSTQAALEGKHTRVLRPRTLIYGALLLALIVGFGVAVARRTLVEVDVLRDRNALYRELDDGGIENVYTVRLVNKDTRAHEFVIGVEGLAASLATDLPSYRLEAGAVGSAVAHVSVPRGTVSGGREIRFVVTARDTDIQASSEARFIAPAAP